MGGFLKYLDKLETRFNDTSIRKCMYKNRFHENCNDINIVEDEYAHVDISNIEKSNISNIDVYKNNLINELLELGLNETKINQIFYNVFNSKKPIENNKHKNIKQENKKINVNTVQESISDRASLILDGVTDSVVNHSYNFDTQHQNINMSSKMPLNGNNISNRASLILDSDNINSTSVLPSMNDSYTASCNYSSAPLPLLQLPEGFEQFKPNVGVPINDALKILNEPSEIL